MAEVAAHVTDNVLPHLPVRQWVLSLPKRLRPFLHHNPDIAGAVLRIFLRAIRTTLCRASPGAPRDAQLAAISFLHRFGSALNTHFHYHCAVLDGAFSQGPDGDARFHEATLPMACPSASPLCLSILTAHPCIPSLPTPSLWASCHTHRTHSAA